MVQVQQFGTGLALGVALKFYTSVTVGFKLRKVWGLIPTFVEITGGKLVGCEGISTFGRIKMSIVNKKVIYKTGMCRWRKRLYCPKWT